MKEFIETYGEVIFIAFLISIVITGLSWMLLQITGG